MSSIRWTEEELREYLGRKQNNNRAAVPVADSKSARRAATPAPAEAQKVYPRFRIHIHHRSKRLADATGRSHKAAVDGIVRGGILRDDKPEFLESISETYEQSQVEETVITLEKVK